MQLHPMRDTTRHFLREVEGREIAMRGPQFIFLGFLAGRDQLDRAFAADPAPQVSAAKFETAILEGLAANGAKVRVVGALPIASYPHSKILLVARSSFTTAISGVSGVLAFSLNLPLLKLGLRLVTTLHHGIRLLRSGEGRGGIIVYSLHTPYLAAAIVLKRLFGVPVSIFIPDLPMHMAGRTLTGLHGAVKGLDNRLLRRLVASADLAFPITEEIANAWLPADLRYLVVEGIAPAVEPAGPIVREKSARTRILYTGSFSHILKVVRMFCSRPELNVDLVLVGGGPDLEELQQLAAEDQRIAIKPFMVGESLQREFEAADFLINPRDTLWEGARYSFPSKLFDYMTRGLPVLSTSMPGIPPEYFECFFALDDRDTELFAASLVRALTASREEIETRVAAGERLLTNQKSAKATGARILEALSSC
jgi:glycosyltransferase involved in cell wall biosynthesis